MFQKKRAYRVVVLVVAGSIALAACQLIGGSARRQFTNGKLEGADYWRAEPVILSAGFGFDNIIGLPELTEESVHQAGGSWYGSLRCTNGQEPATPSWRRDYAATMVTI